MKVLVKITKDVLFRSRFCPALRLAKTQNQAEVIKESCAVSVAWRDLFPEAKVSQQTTKLMPSCPSMKNSIEMIEYIDMFDHCLTESERMDLPEASFEVEIPDYIIDKIGISQIYKVLSESRTLELVHP